MKKLMRIVFILAFSKNFKRLLKIIAKSADEIAPIKINETSFILIPSRIKFPKPPAPIKAASVAVPMTITVLVRIPAMIKGIANESSNFINRSLRFIPNAVAASIKEGSICSKPV